LEIVVAHATRGAARRDNMAREFEFHRCNSDKLSRTSGKTAARRGVFGISKEGSSSRGRAVGRGFEWERRAGLRSRVSSRARPPSLGYSHTG